MHSHKFLFLLLLFCNLKAFAAHVSQVKDNRVLIDLEEDSTVINQKIYLLNADGKRVAVGNIVQIRNKKAIALLKKGKSKGYEAIEFSNESISPEKIALTDYGQTLTTAHRKGSYRIAATLTVGIDTMSTKQSDATQPTPNNDTVTMKGNSIGLTATGDYNFNDWLVIRATFGYEPFNSSGSSQFVVCNNLTSKDCTANISYLSAGGYLRYDISKSKLTTWVGGGAVLKFPIANSTTALKSDDIRLTTTFGLAFGVDYFINAKNFVPASIEYQQFQNSDTVSANIIILRGGYGWSF